MLYLVCYDIVQDRRRTKVAKVLETYGTRVQKSVFEVMADDRQYPRLRDRLLRLLDEKTDQLRFYPLPGRVRRQVVILGVQPTFAIDDATFVV